MTDMTITERLKAIRERLLGDITYKKGTSIYTYQNEIDHLTAILQTIEGAETDAGKLADSFLSIAFELGLNISDKDEGVFHGVIKQAITAALLKAGQQRWMDISTAPKDKDILVYQNPREIDGGYTIPEAYGVGSINSNGQFKLKGGDCELELDRPNYWQPLPSPPSSQGGE
jgi:hypothetical protein